MRSEGAFGSVSGPFGGRGRATLRQAESVELRVEELLQAETSFGLVSVTRVVLKTVGEHQLHVGDELAWRHRDRRQFESRWNHNVLKRLVLWVLLSGFGFG